MTDSPGDDPNLRPLGESLSAAARKSGFGAVEPGEAPTSGALLKAMGGVRGLVESILPGLAFLVIYTVTKQVAVSVLIPVGLAVVFVVLRAITRTPWTSALAGVIGVALSAGLALITGDAKDNFVLGFFLNGAFLLALVVSLLARWPLIGVIVALIRGEGPGWRADAARFRVATIATLLWVGLFALRLIVELPLYFADNTSALATLKLILGVPLYAGMLWVTWLLVRTVYARPDRS
ncbi:DUF3159 domain-containing protein [soil metagenome]